MTTASIEQEGHIQVDLGMDTPFLQEDVPLTIEAAARVRANVQRLVEFTSKVEKNAGANAGCYGRSRIRTSRRN